MTHILEQQTEVQSTKEFGKIKGVEALSVKELKEVEGGGILGAVVAGVAVYLIISSIEHPEDFARGFLGK